MDFRIVVAAGGILALRMLGLFMVVPLFALYAMDLKGATPMLTGLALGAYGLTQAVLQIPLGRLSDHYGRKRVIAGGLIVFLLGSVVAALATDINQLLVGRLLQGAGAISSSVLALVGDATTPRKRSLSMAVLGMSMGLAFLLAIVIGPWLGSQVGFLGMFWVAAFFAALALLLVTLLPGHSAARLSGNVHVPASSWKEPWDGKWVPWNLAIFLTHLLLTASFLSFPVLLSMKVGLDVALHAWVYLGTMFGSCLIAIPLLIYVEQRFPDTLIWHIAAGFFIAGLLIMAFAATDVFIVCLGMLLFFIGFNLLEASLPAGLSRRTHASNRGQIMGMFASHQFMGAFVGGVLGGALMQMGDSVALFAGLAVVVGLWLVFLLAGASRSVLDEYVFEPEQLSADQISARSGDFLHLPGVRRVWADSSAGTVIVEVERRRFRAGPLWKFMDKVDS